VNLPKGNFTMRITVSSASNRTVRQSCFSEPIQPNCQRTKPSETDWFLAAPMHRLMTLAQVQILSTRSRKSTHWEEQNLIADQIASINRGNHRQTTVFGSSPLRLEQICLARRPVGPA
jgi:hypothetical protein